VRAAMQSDGTNGTNGTHLLISVRDNGIGIPKAFQPRVWGRFERYDEHALVMDVAGTGLGLSIAKQIVEMHRGEIWFDSEEDEGTTFYISLPVQPHPTAQPAENIAQDERGARQ
jgi:two-component system sensor histidine kinase VicK